MPVSYDINEKLVHLHLVGEYAPADIRDCLKQALADPQFPAEAWVLMDVTESNSLQTRSADDLRNMAAYLAQLSPRFGTRMGIAAGSRLHYGMMRMAEVYSESSGLTARVFPTTEEAIGWLAEIS